MTVSDSKWIRGEPPKHILIDKISPKQVKSELNLYARLEDHFQISETEIVNVSLLPIDSERLCASILFNSGYKAWEFVRSFSKDQCGFSWEVRVDQSARQFEKIKAKNNRENSEKVRRLSYRDDHHRQRDDDEYRNSDSYKPKVKMSCSAFVPCLKVPFSCELSLKFKLDEKVFISLFPVTRFPSISGVEEGTSSWHIHFGREIDVVEADRMLQKDIFKWKGHEFYFDKWDLMKNDIPWDIPDHYTKSKQTNFDVLKMEEDDYEAFKPPPQPLPNFQDLSDGDYMDLPKFKKKKPEIDDNEQVIEKDLKDESGIKVKVKRKPIKKLLFIPPPIVKPDPITKDEPMSRSDADNDTKHNDADIHDNTTVPVIVEGIVDNPMEIVKVEIECPVLKSGSVRTEGYFQLEPTEKRRVKFNGILEAFSSSGGPSTNGNSSSIGSNDLNSGRSSRAQNRRPLLQTASNATMDLFKVSPLQSTQKLVALRNSSIHSYGLVLMEPAEPGDLIIEYVGELVRASVANIREWKYEREYRGDGIASSYLFRLDGIMVIDATHQGNLARFINHSCDPNCFAKTISLNGSKRIVLYAKKSIRGGEEITYDYKFPTEKDPKKKVKCLCGSNSCRKYLN